jgi:predicted kinase
MMDINLHCMVVLVGTVGSNRLDWALEHFRPEEIVSADQIRLGLTGRSDCFTQESAVFAELERQVALRIHMGQRVVVDASNLKRTDRASFERQAQDAGVACVIVVFDQPLNERLQTVNQLGDLAAQQAQLLHVQQSLFLQAKKDLAAVRPGVTVIAHTDPVRIAVRSHPLPQRILAVGDVHGNYAAMAQAQQFAQNNDLFVIWLGDVIDYGGHNLKCMRLAYDMVCNNQAHMIWGNHERKIGRWLSSQGSHPIKLSEANLATVREIQSLSDQRRARFLSAWHCWESASTQCVRVNRWLFTHGAATEHMWNTRSHRLQGVCQNMAYFGEVEQLPTTRRDGYPQRLWNWVNNVPAGHSVVVGHDWLDRENCAPVIKTNAHQGRVFCMDTGSSKGGRLSGLIVDTQTDEWEIRSFDP